MLIGSRGTVTAVAVDPEGRWIAAGYVSGFSVHLWRMPVGRPFHALPLDDCLDRLCSRTNLRVVADRNAPAGYRLDQGPFSGWDRLQAGR